MDAARSCSRRRRSRPRRGCTASTTRPSARTPSIGPGGDAAVVRIRGTDRALAVKTDCNGRYVYLDPRVGAQIAVCEAARNVACTGARPMAITNNLNFGNPRRPDVYFQLREAVRGMAEACAALGTPVTGGNVSLYNESPAGAVYPTPVIGMVGLIESLDHVTRSHFAAERDTIVLLGEPTQRARRERIPRAHPRHRRRRAAGLRLDAERALDRRGARVHQRRRRRLRARLQPRRARGRARRVLHHGSRRQARRVDRPRAWRELPPRALLFGEAQGRVILSTTMPDTVLGIARAHGVPARAIGQVGALGAPLQISLAGARLEVPLGAPRRGLSRSDPGHHGSPGGTVAIVVAALARHSSRIQARSSSAFPQRPDVRHLRRSRPFRRDPSRPARALLAAASRAGIGRRRRRSTTPARRAPCGAWARCPTRSRVSWPRFPASPRSATRATAPPARRRSRTRSRSSPARAAGTSPSRTTAT